MRRFSRIAALVLTAVVPWVGAASCGSTVGGGGGGAGGGAGGGDASAAMVCGDGVCDDGETFATCPQDCSACGDGVCDDVANEDCTTCPADCGEVCCGDSCLSIVCDSKSGDPCHGCADLCDNTYTGATAPDFCNGGEASSECTQCMLANTLTSPSDCN